MMNGEKHTKYDVNLEKGTTEWVGEKMANELISIDKRKKHICHYVFVIQSIITLIGYLLTHLNISTSRRRRYIQLQ